MRREEPGGLQNKTESQARHTEVGEEQHIRPPLVVARPVAAGAGATAGLRPRILRQDRRPPEKAQRMARKVRAAGPPPRGGRPPHSLPGALPLTAAATSQMKQKGDLYTGRAPRRQKPGPQAAKKPARDQAATHQAVESAQAENKVQTEPSVHFPQGHVPATEAKEEGQDYYVGPLRRVVQVQTQVLPPATETCQTHASPLASDSLPAKAP